MAEAILLRFDLDQKLRVRLSENKEIYGVNFEFVYALFSEWGSMYEKSTYGNYRECLIFRGWALTDSNRRPSACKADALNQLS